MIPSYAQKRFLVYSKVRGPSLYCLLTAQQAYDVNYRIMYLRKKRKAHSTLTAGARIGILHLSLNNWTKQLASLKRTLSICLFGKKILRKRYHWQRGWKLEHKPQKIPQDVALVDDELLPARDNVSHLYLCGKLKTSTMAFQTIGIYSVVVIVLRSLFWHYLSCVVETWWFEDRNLSWKRTKVSLASKRR